MRIAVFGYYNAGNTGDDRLKEAWLDILGHEHDLTFLRHDSLPAIRVLRKFDWVLIGGGGLVFGETGIWLSPEDWIQKSGVKIGVAGLGVNSVTPLLNRSLKILGNKSRFFFVRDLESRRLCTEAGCNPEVYPDLSWCLPRRELVDPQATAVAVNFAPCWWKPMDVEAWSEMLPKTVLLPVVFDHRDSVVLKKMLPGNVPEAFCVEPLTRCRFLIGSRYHSLLFAMQLRVPCIAVAYDHKVSRLMHEAGLSELCLDTSEPQKLPDVIALLELRRSEFIEKIEAYATTQELKARELVDRIRRSIADVPPIPRMVSFGNRLLDRIFRRP